MGMGSTTTVLPLLSRHKCSAFGGISAALRYALRLSLSLRLHLRLRLSLRLSLLISLPHDRN